VLPKKHEEYYLDDELGLGSFAIPPNGLDRPQARLRNVVE
jgi:hypothetical protein